MKLSLRGIGPRVVTAYLLELGGNQLEGGEVAGPGWRARVSACQPFQIGALRVGVTEVHFSGDPEAVTRIMARLQEKTLRVGG